MQEKLKEAKYSYNPEDQYQVGLMFRDGIEVEQDYKEAKDWFRRAAFKEHAASQFNLAVISAKKLAGSFSSDYETKSWLKKAAKQEHAGAKKLLDMVEAGDDLPEPKVLFSLDTSAAAAAALPEPSPTPEPEPSPTPEPEPSPAPEPEPSPAPEPDATSSVEKPDPTPVAEPVPPAITKQSTPPSPQPLKSEEPVEAPQTPPPPSPPPVIAEKDTPSPSPPAIKQPTAAAKIFDKDESVSATQYQPDDIAEYSGEDWDIRISMDHAPLEEAFYFPVKDDPDATNESIQSVLEKYALNTERSNELDSDKYPQLPHIQEELLDYYESGKSGQVNLSIYVNKRPSGEPIQLGDTVSQHLSSCIFHDGSFDYRLLDLVFVIESKSMESSELKQYRQEYGHTFMLFLIDYMKRNSSATPGDALFSSDPFHGFLSDSNDPDQFPKVTQALKSAVSAEFIQSSTPSQVFAKDLPGATTKYQPDDLAEYAGEPWDIRISMRHETLEDAFYFPVKDDPDATNESIQSVLEKYALNTDRSNELDIDEYPLMPNLQRELRGYYNSGKSGQPKLSIYVNKRPSNGPIQLEDPVAQHLSTCVFNDGSFDYRLLDLVFVIEDGISITQEGSDKLKSIKREVDNLTRSYERYQSALGNPPTLGVPDGDGYDARIQIMRRNSVDVVRAIFLFAFIYNEDDLFGDPNWAASYESGQSFSAIMDAFQYESKFSDKILDALVSL